MSIEKQKLYNKIETLPDTEGPDSVTIKSKKDLKEKLQKGIDDTKANRVYSLEEALARIDEKIK